MNDYCYVPPKFTNCTFIQNSAQINGGTIYNVSASPIMTECVFKANHAGRDGGAMYYDSGDIGDCYPELTGCSLIANSATERAGAIYLRLGAVTADKSTFSGNSAQQGGGIYTVYAHDIFTNCIFSANYATEQGGAIYANPFLRNCTFSANSAPAYCTVKGVFDAINCIFWDETLPAYEPGTYITYSDIRGGYPGQGNINSDPRFVDAAGPDNIPGTKDDNLRLLGDSPCIDAATYIPPNSQYPGVFDDIEGNPRPIDVPNIDNNGDLPDFDMGAYEYVPPMTIEAQIRIKPRVLNLYSHGRFVFCTIRLPDGYDVTDIDRSSILLQNEIEPRRVFISQRYRCAFAIFNRTDLQPILSPGRVELSLTGRLTDGPLFEGTNYIWVIKPLRRPPWRRPR